MKIYISGPITGHQDYLERFQEAEDKLTALGHQPVNPTKLVPFQEGKTWLDYMREDIKILLDCEAIYMTKGWDKSKGAITEWLLAKQLGYKIIYQAKN